MSWVFRNRWQLAATATFLLILVAASTRVAVYSINQDVFDDTLASAGGGTQIEQTFISHFPGLTAITLQLVEPFPPADQPVALSLIDLSPEPRERLAVSGPLSKFAVGGELRFTFQPLDDTTARRYRLVIATQGAQPLLLRAHRLNLYTDGELAGGGDLMFDIRYNSYLVPTLLALLPRLTENKPGLLGRSWPYVVLAVIYAAILVKSLASIVRAPQAATAGRPTTRNDRISER